MSSVFAPPFGGLIVSLEPLIAIALLESFLPSARTVTTFARFGFHFRPLGSPTLTVAAFVPSAPRGRSSTRRAGLVLDARRRLTASDGEQPETATGTERDSDPPACE